MEKIFQPIVQSGPDAGLLPVHFIQEFSSKHGFHTESNCTAWIRDHSDSLTLRELYGNVVAQMQEVENPIPLDQ